MKMLVHRIPLTANAPFVLDELKEYTRISHPDDDVTLNTMGWAAAAEIEHFAQVALLAQSVRITLLQPELGSGLALPVAPVIDSASLTVTVDGLPFSDFECFGGLRPYLKWFSGRHVSQSSSVVIEYEAGFGTEAASIPRDLSQAILDHVALIFDGRGALEAKILARSSHLARVGARYRGVSL